MVGQTWSLLDQSAAVDIRVGLGSVGILWGGSTLSRLGVGFLIALMVFGVRCYSLASLYTRSIHGFFNLAVVAAEAGMVIILQL
ncbi:hypothetical protein GF373_14025 [bacterium]|nr:hypothetical protein [bacterium]